MSGSSKNFWEHWEKMGTLIEAHGKGYLKGVW
jgi:hypothetical protein